MSDRKLPPISDVFAYWQDNVVRIALHGRTGSDDCRGELTAMQALKLAEQLTRAAREGLTAAAVTGLEYRGG
jgi:hypothetical protein